MPDHANKDSKYYLLIGLSETNTIGYYARLSVLLGGTTLSSSTPHGLAAQHSDGASTKADL